MKDEYIEKTILYYLLKMGLLINKEELAELTNELRPQIKDLIINKTLNFFQRKAYHG
jgi:hypothetical protein